MQPGQQSYIPLEGSLTATSKVPLTVHHDISRQVLLVHTLFPSQTSSQEAPNRLGQVMTIGLAIIFVTVSPPSLEWMIFYSTNEPLAIASCPSYTASPTLKAESTVTSTDKSGHISKRP